MATVTVLAVSDLENDPRVNRQLRFLHGRYRLVAGGLLPPKLPGVTFVPFPTKKKPKPIPYRFVAAARRLTGRYVTYYWNKMTIRDWYAGLRPHRADLIISNDIMTLPLAVGLAEEFGAKVMYDAHEYAPREFEDLWKWRLLEAPFVTALCKEYMPRVDAMTTVCQGIADEYERLTGVRASLLTNAPDFNDLNPRPCRDGDPVRLVHHGGAIPSRKLENMIDMMPHLDERFQLDFVLVGANEGYRAKLERRAAKVGRVRFLPPVPMIDLPRFLNAYDLGVFLLEPTNFNYLHALPNKLFEFLQGRIGVAIGPSPEMARVVRETGTGVVAPDFRPATLAGLLNRLTTADINQFKARAHACAREYSADRNRQTFLGLCEALCPPAPAARVA
ncbi:MAG: glycosyltransferase [Zavarzinella sp.]|nr:glycosyltransferase [Zavarzinella sp.]